MSINPADPIPPPPPVSPPPPDPPLPPRRRRRWLRLLVLTAAAAALVLGGAAGYVVNMDLPDVRALEDYQPPTISQILAHDGRVIHQFAEQRRLVVPVSRISDTLQKAVIAAEDSNFLEHVGVDPVALARAALRDLAARRWAQGGSTLTQQLAKILFTRSEKTLRRKIQEAILAVQIEKTYTKEEILEFYLNQIYMGHGRYGMEAAAQYYFGAPASGVNVEQAALLAGIIQRPEAYSPFKDPNRALRRRDYVLDRMLEERFLTPEVAALAGQAPLVLAPGERGESEAPFFAEEIRKILAPRYGDDVLLREGLSVTTGLDLDLQRAAEAALSKGLRSLDKRRGFRRPGRNVLSDGKTTLDGYQHPGWDRPVRRGDLVTGLVTKVTAREAAVRLGRASGRLRAEDAAWTDRDDLTRLLRPGDLTLFEVVETSGGALRLALDQEPEVEGAVLALDPRTGDVRAMVGGFDFARSQFNRAVQAMRQCGSAFKPFIYAAAVEDGHTPSDLLYDAPTVFRDPTSGTFYQPENYERRYEGVVTLRKALEESINIPTVTLLNEVGYERTVTFARKVGVTSTLHAYPSLALGSSEVTLTELTAAYGVFPTGGILARPRLYAEVRDRDGDTLEETKPEAREVIRSDVAAVMVSLMRGVLQRGTAAAHNRPGAPIAGKTGTTDDYTDAWFVGFSPSLVLGVWVGNDRKVTLGPQETGARAALPVWIEVMDDWLARHRGEAFPKSPGVTTVPVDYDTGLRADGGSGCRAVVEEAFVKGTEVAHSCTQAAHARAALPYFLQRYSTTADGGLRIPEDEIERLLRENPWSADLVGRSSLNVLTPAGIRMVRLERRAPEGGDVTWGFFRRDPTPPAEDSSVDADGAQLLPGASAPLSSGTYPFVGVDGRRAGVIEIRYP